MGCEVFTAVLFESVLLWQAFEVHEFSCRECPFFLSYIMNSFTMPQIHTEQILKDFGIYYNCPVKS